jgi:hypothetical protein
MAANLRRKTRAYFNKFLEIDQNSYGPENPDVARDLNNLARKLQVANRLDEAEPLMRRVVDIFLKVYAPPAIGIRTCKQSSTTTNT